MSDDPQGEYIRRTSKALKSVLESSVEEYFVARVEALGGVAEKTRAIGSRGYFDRVAVVPVWYGRTHPKIGQPVARVIFAELKRPKGGRLAIHQAERRDRYVAMGAEAVVLKSKEDVDALLGPAL